jgi:hypothetical protein
MPDAKALLLDLVAVIPDGDKSAVFFAEGRVVGAELVLTLFKTDQYLGGPMKKLSLLALAAVFLTSASAASAQGLTEAQARAAIAP